MVTVVYCTFYTHLTFLHGSTLPAQWPLTGGGLLGTLEQNIAVTETELQHLIRAMTPMKSHQVMNGEEQYTQSNVSRIS